jgi:glycosyltransferase involved in cell wall biosynthesis
LAKVSAIIPAYNCERYIKETVESVLAQTYKDIELIVVDDGSTDRTGEILKTFGFRVKYIYQSKNTGPSGARNKGIERAEGEYIAFLDHDDVWMPNKIEEQIKLLEGNEDVALVYSNGYYVGPSGLTRGTLFDNIKPHRNFVLEELLVNSFIPTSSVVVKKQILNKVGWFSERFLVTQDFDLYLRIAEQHKIDFVGSPLLKHRVHPDSLSNRKRRLMLEEAISIIKFYRDKIAFNNQHLARIVDRNIAKYMFYLAIWLLCNAGRRKAIMRYLDCIKTGAFDYKIALGSVFFIMPKFISTPMVKNLIKIDSSWQN